MTQCLGSSGDTDRPIAIALKTHLQPTYFACTCSPHSFVLADYEFFLPYQLCLRTRRSQLSALPEPSF
ncbi:hypothetical protein [Vacuolonema iberomarrocanum]|uniref:hypothetical protein n=1 Tax=Vacuolonema iberomarrocanum TaxID=3454632 RepID=UPI0019E59790|nr:hypothetical protein [filamentous cyanobacterium LEGE 07170]